MNPVLLFLIVLIIFIFLKIVLFKKPTNLEKGDAAERDLVFKLVKHFEEKHVFHNLYIKKSKGCFSQVDLLLLTDVGIIVIEVKNYSGWIFGSGSQKNWVQILSYGKRKNYFYNPILQNKGHILALKDTLKEYSNVPFYSLIVFYGSCELKSIKSIPMHTYVTEVYEIFDTIEQIITNHKIVEYDKDSIGVLLSQHVENGNNQDIVEQHSNNIQKITEMEF